MKIEEAKIIMCKDTMECVYCPRYHGSCKGVAPCETTALEAGRMVIAEASKDAYEMAVLAIKLLEQLSKLNLLETSQTGVDKSMAEALNVQLKYERAVDSEN